LSGTAHHHYKKTSASSSRKPGVGRLCKNLDATSSGRHQSSVHTKGEIHHSAASSGRSGAASSPAVRKDLIGRSSTITGKRTGPLSNGLVHSDGARELKLGTGGKLKTSKR
jgi:hypothetical protein